MARVWGFDIGTTSIGWAVIEHEVAQEAGRIIGMGVRIFPEARDPDGTPLNQTRRQKRMARRQLRRRRERRKALNQMLADAGLLPPFSKDKDSAWSRVMALPPLPIRARALSERIEPHELGRALYHLAKRRHFKGRDLEESDTPEAEDADEKAASDARKRTIAEFKATGRTLVEALSVNFPAQGDRELRIKGAVPIERTRGVHALRSHVEEEFERLWSAQTAYHPALTDALKAHVGDVIFAQKPVFWRKNTLGQCRFIPGAPLCLKGSWLSAQRRMLEKLNNLAFVGGNMRPLDDNERAAILGKLQTQASMSWAGVKKALAPVYKARGETGRETSLQFNLEKENKSGLLGNPREVELARIFGSKWEHHPHKQAIRDTTHERLWNADYCVIQEQRVVILPDAKRRERRTKAAEAFIEDFGIAADEAKALSELQLPAGWEPFSTEALKRFLPKLEEGVRFGDLDRKPEWAGWREENFPDRDHPDKPTGEILDKLPSPKDPEEQKRLSAIRNPTVARTQNELRKVVNNLLSARSPDGKLIYGKPDLIRIELARKVGRSKRQREDDEKRNRTNRKRREVALKEFREHRIEHPSPRDIDKWLLWKECNALCPYSGENIGWDQLFSRTEFDIEHIWPRELSIEPGMGNLTLCKREWNIKKGKRTPYDAFNGTDEWDAMKRRIWRWVKEGKFPQGKARRFCREEPLDDGFRQRQLNDTSYAAKQIVASLKRLWPDVGPEAPVTVQAVTGRVTAQLRRRWCLDDILSDEAKKTRADHRHHAIDALVVACTHPGVTKALADYWKQKDDPRARRPHLSPPWPSIRADAEQVVESIVVSHRVRKKISGPLHEETIRHPVNGSERAGLSDPLLVARKPVAKLTPSLLASDEAIRDPHVRLILREWIAEHGGDAKKAFQTYPSISPDGPPIKKVRVGERRQLKLMAPVANGYADAGLNHHIAVYRNSAGKTEFEVVTLFEASRRVSKRQPIVNRARNGAAFVASFSPGETVELTADDGERSRWVVVGIEGDGRAALSPLNDARPGDAKAAKAAGFESARIIFRPRIGGLMKREPRKVSIDPIGRVRPAND